MSVYLKFKKLHEDAIIPKFAHHGDAGFDLHAIENNRVMCGRTTMIKTGLAVEIPHGYEMQIRPRSGLAAKFGMTIINAPGTIDSGYRGELMVMCTLISDTEYIVLEKGSRIAQGVIKKLEDVVISEVVELSDTARGEGGLGSTGK